VPVGCISRGIAHSRHIQQRGSQVNSPVTVAPLVTRPTESKRCHAGGAPASPSRRSCWVLSPVIQGWRCLSEVLSVPVGADCPRITRPRHPAAPALPELLGVPVTSALPAAVNSPVTVAPLVTANESSVTLPEVLSVRRRFP
jgi:hypothetical protein